MITRGEVAAKSHQWRLHCLGHRYFIRIESIDRIRRHKRKLVQVDTLIASDFHYEVRRLKTMQSVRWHLKLEVILLPLFSGCVHRRRRKYIAVPHSKRYGQGRWSADMARKEATFVVEFALCGKIDLLLNAGRLPLHPHHDERSPGVRGISPSRLIAVALFGVQRLPRQRQTECGRSRQLRMFMHHRFQIARAPQILLERWVHQKLRPQAVVGRVTNGFKEAAKDCSGNGRPCRFPCVYRNRGSGRYRFDNADLRAGGTHEERGRSDEQRGAER